MHGKSAKDRACRDSACKPRPYGLALDLFERDLPVMVAWGLFGCCPSVLLTNVKPDAQHGRSTRPRRGTRRSRRRSRARRDLRRCRAFATHGTCSRWHVRLELPALAARRILSRWSQAKAGIRAL